LAQRVSSSTLPELIFASPDPTAVPWNSTSILIEL
jgi:hypothetical protein